MKPTIFSLAILLVLMASCGKRSADDYQALKAQNDSLQNAKLKLQDEVDGYFSAMNEIEQNIEKIKSTQNSISVQPAGQEMTDDVRTKIKEDMSYLNEMLQTNKDELDRLKAKLRKSGFRSTELEQTISRLSKSLEEESSKVAELQIQLSQKDSLITQLSSSVNDMGKNIEDLSVNVKEKDTRIKEKETKIKEQDETIHTAWYVFGTKKELKEQRIVTSEGLFSPQRVLQSDFNKNYFVRIDARNTKSIPLYSTRAKILTTHPKSSYTLEKENGNFILLIVEPNQFWSISKYLVIEVE